LGAGIANVQPGDDVAVFGAGPVGYFAVMSSFYGEQRVFAVDHWPTRLNKVKDLGAEVINFDNEGPVEWIRKETNRKGAICIDAVGYEAVGHTADGHGRRDYGTIKHDHSEVSDPAYDLANPLQVINWMCQATRKYSTLSIPGSEYDNFPLGQQFQRELQIELGQCPVKKYNEQLLHLIETKE
jgi:S-(hydroxymethyl)glutathione dehydrogenase/alcohol dehydrogenase